jgi:hypothetical protein
MHGAYNVKLRPVTLFL